MRLIVLLILVVLLIVAILYAQTRNRRRGRSDQDHVSIMDKHKKSVKTEEEWRNQLSPMEYNVTRQKGTERAFTGKYWDHHDSGTYVCVCCGQPLFASDTKFNSGTGWPSFFEPYAQKNVDEYTDRTHGMVRTEVTCSRCDAHLGHVFPCI
jgi:peptide-methionine (R)-S-oxide reductase